MLSYRDPLPGPPRRVLVAGVSGSGKTTLSAVIAEVTGGAHTEIDALFHGPDWTPRLQFLADVCALVSADTWITEWQYGSARKMLAEHADVLVWLDLPFVGVTFPRLLRRTLRRRRCHEVLWNGNVEPPLHTLLTDPAHVVRWAVRHRHKYRDQVPPLKHSYPHLVIVRLTSRREVRQWVAGPLTLSVL